MNKNNKEIRFSLRVPKSLWEKFKKISITDKRSENAELNWLIEKEVNQRKTN